ncbi:hypothetical protein ABKN59_004631 [Abortiporus biennis]
MPIDGHAYLVSQGWQGKGSGLRHGAISRPIAVTQKKTLAGIGKDRDEAFPFWDHVFSAAADKIKLKLANSDDEDSDNTDEPPSTDLRRTQTGIISNRRPIQGTPAISGTSTPSDPSSSSGASTPRLSLLAAAKQEAARRTLYSMFYRGPIMKSDHEVLKVVDTISEEIDMKDDKVTKVRITETIEVNFEEETSKGKKKKEKRKDKADGKKQKKDKKKGKERATDGHDSEEEVEEVSERPKKKWRSDDKDVGSDVEEDEDEESRKKKKVEKRASKEERRRRREERKKREDNAAVSASDSECVTALSQPQESSPNADQDGSLEKKRKYKKDKNAEKSSKKKRKRTDE